MSKERAYLNRMEEIPNSVELCKQGLISISLQESLAVIRLMPCPDIGQMSYIRRGVLAHSGF